MTPVLGDPRSSHCHTSRNTKGFPRGRLGQAGISLGPRDPSSQEQSSEPRRPTHCRWPRQVPPPPQEAAGRLRLEPNTPTGIPALALPATAPDKEHSYPHRHAQLGPHGSCVHNHPALQTTSGSLSAGGTEKLACPHHGIPLGARTEPPPDKHDRTRRSQRQRAEFPRETRRTACWRPAVLAQVRVRTPAGNCTPPPLQES